MFVRPSHAVTHVAQVRSRGSVWHISQSYWLCVGYMFFWTIWRLSVAPLAERSNLVAFGGVTFLAALVLAIRSRTAAQRGGYGKGYTSRWHALYPIAHILLIIAGVRLTGAADSPFWVVLFVALIAETVLAPPRESLVMRWAAGIALFFSTIPLPFEGRWLPDFCTRLLFLILVSVIAGRLRQLSSERDAELSGLRAEMAAVEERGKLSREIHDQVGNTLAASVLRLDVAARTLEKQGDSERADVLREEAGGLRVAMNKIRDWTFLTRPWIAEDVDTPALVLERETARMARRCGLPVTVTEAVLLELLPIPARLAALRITQESLANIVKHAHNAQTVSVALWRDGNAVCLRIADDGVGFDVSSANDSVGLAAMRERARGANGELTIQSTKGEGTSITARFPTL